jgi:mono/diheme cytochrome c family protein
MSQPNDGQEHIDSRETADITEVHASVLREHSEPRTDRLPIPTWLGVLCTVSLCWAGAYVGMFHGGFKGTVYNEYESSPNVLFPTPGGQPNDGPKVEESLFAIGQKVYASCVPCHGPAGTGSNAIPPLAGSDWLTGAEAGDKRVIALLLKGAAGAFAVNGQTYNGVMPAWETLKDKQIAGVITFVHQSWGNKGGEVTEEMVKAVRKEMKSRTAPWSMPDLKAIPVDAKIEGAGAAPAASAPAAAAPAGAKTEAKPAVAGAPAAAPAAVDPAAASFDLPGSIAAGKSVYMATCMACHQMTGAGLPGAFPPLAKTDFVTGDTRRFVAIVLKGVSGAITVEGKVYATGMPQPDTTFPQLKDDKNMANVLNYVRNSFGNKNDTPITPEYVAKLRKEFESRTTQWTEQELLNFPPAK